MAYRPPILNAQRIMQARLHRQRLLEALANRIAQLEEMQAQPAVGGFNQTGFARPSAASAARSSPLGFARPSAAQAAQSAPLGFARPGMAASGAAAVGPAGAPAPQVPASLLSRLPFEDVEVPEGWEETLRRVLPQLFRRDLGIESYAPPGRFVAY